MNAATAAVARICTKRTPQPADFLVNIGTCAKFLTQKDPVKLVEMYRKKKPQPEMSTFFRQEKNSTGTVSKGRRSVSVQKDHGACDRAYILSGYFIQTSFEEAEIVTGAMLYHTEKQKQS
mgnify:CR=1 FL=1